MSNAVKPDFSHPEYVKSLQRWARCRAVVEGEEAVHKMGETALPKLTAQTPEEYAAYVKRTPFFNASGRTVEGMAGLVFRKSPITVMPPSVAAMLEDITLTGITAESFANEMLTEVETVNRVGVLVEYPRMSAPAETVAQVEALNLRPYFSMYKAESIINWRVSRVNNVMRPVLVVLVETTEVEGTFETTFSEQIRALRLAEGVYTQEIYRKTNEKNGWVLTETLVPLMNNAPMGFIPFFMNEGEFQVKKPPLLDLFDLNLSHYRTTADLEHGAHFTGLPMLFVAGVDLKQDEAISLGSSTAFTAPNPAATATFTEFTGQGLGSLEKLLDRKEAQMAAIGARMLAPEKSGVEAAQTLEIKRAGETSVLASHANAVSATMTKALAVLAQWMGVSGEISYRLNTDFLPLRLSAQELTAMVGAWQSGAVSKQTFFYNLQQGELVAPGKTFEEEQADIETSAPTIAGNGVSA